VLGKFTYLVELVAVVCIML